jgi:radical SAM protein with 4Fe4S-binding SPASM domain
MQWRWYEYNTGQTKLRSLPDVFAIESTNFCNLKCIMCPRGEPDLMERPLGHMSDDVFKRVVAGWEFFTEPCWLHLFGEPLMHPQIFDQIEYAKANGVPNVGISSNATLLTKMNSARLLDSGLDTIILSIDGATKATYEKIRKSPAFTHEEVRENAREFLAMRQRMRKAKPHTIVQIIVMEETRDELAAFKAEWEAAGADEVLLKQYTVWGDQEHHDTFLELAPAEQRKWYTSQPTRANPCYNLWSTVVIAWDGRVVPCCFDYDAIVTLGDLRENTLAEIWNGEKYQAIRAAELAGRNDNPLCKNCKEAPGFARNPLTPAPSAIPDESAVQPVEAYTAATLGI